MGGKKTCWWLTLCGALSAGCWWRIQALGDLRWHLPAFYGWFGAAFALYVASLWLVSRHAQPTRGSLGLIILIAVLARLTVVGTTPTLSGDLYRYQWDGRVQLAGMDPYRYPPDDPALRALRDAQCALINFPHLRTVYPPLTELAFRLGAAWGGPLASQKLAFVCAELVTVFSLASILISRGRSPLWIAAYAWHPLAILEIAGSGHNDALGIACLWLGIAAWGSRRWAGCALAWAAAFLSKFLSVVLVPWWWFRRTARGWLAACVLLAILPVALHRAEVSALIESLSAMTARTSSNASLYLLLDSGLRHAKATPLVACGIWALGLLWWAKRMEDPVRYLLVGLTAAALLSPALHPWYVVWLIPCLCFWRPPAVVALTVTVVLAYMMWPGYLAGGPWAMPLWARLLEYGPVFLLLGWELRRWPWALSFRPATKPQLCLKS